MSSREAEIARCALGNATIHQASFDSARVPDALDMTHKVHEEEVVDQQNTGTCWLQAGMTFLSALARRRGLTVRFSLTHLVYWDKLGKAKAFLEGIRSTCSPPAAQLSFAELRGLCDRLLSQDGRIDDIVARVQTHQHHERIRWHLLSEPISDGGTWAMFLHLIETHGVVPHDARLPMRQATQTAQLNRYLNDFLRQTAQELIEAHPTHHEELIATSTRKVEDALRRAYGPPPKRATLHETAHGRDFDGSPRDLLAMIRQTWPYPLLTHAPDRPNGAYVGTATNDPAALDQDRFRVVDMGTLVDACIQQLECQIPVWFTCEVKFDFCAKHGVAAIGLFDTPLLLGLDRNANKEARMKAQRTSPGHAMLLTGVKLKDGVPVLWRIQNSWGKDHDYGQGFLTADHEWFKEYVFQAAVDAHFLPTMPATEEVKLYPWDVFATVAA